MKTPYVKLGCNDADGKGEEERERDHKILHHVLGVAFPVGGPKVDPVSLTYPTSLA